MFVDVAVDFATDDRLRTYTYSVPSGLRVSSGDLVWVPFGPRPVQGIVMSSNPSADAAEVREIESVVDGGPFLSESQLRVGRWIADYYRTGLFRSCSLMLPPGANRQLHIWLSRSELAAEIEGTLAGLTISPEQESVLESVPERAKIRRDRLIRLVGRSNERYVDALTRQGILRAESIWNTPTVKAVFKQHLRLAKGGDPPSEVARAYDDRRANRRADLTRKLSSLSGTVPRADLSKEFGQSVVRAVLDDGVAEIENVRVDRDPLMDYVVQETINHSLIPEQQAAVHAIQDAISNSSTGSENRSAGRFLLFGVTGSGKTEVYLRAVESCIAAGKRAIVMVPEIAMTPQTLQRFASRFPGQIALQHSGLSSGQRFDQWHRIKSGEYKVVIGSRASIFSPVDDLGLVVIDEEHEWTYKETERTPRYHARDVAERLCDETGSTLILGSATPDVVTYHRTGENGIESDLRLLTLPRRINIALTDRRVSELRDRNGAYGNEIKYPHTKVDVVDMREELRAGHREMLSRALLDALRKNVDEGGKSILFINRRGTASFIQCATCGAMKTCPNCHTTLTLHRSAGNRSGGRLRCHHCSYSVGVERTCRNCGNQGVSRRAAGTQGVEEVLRGFFPETPILRWDSDTARNASQHERLLREFEAQGNQILVGTQMVAKGLDIPEVSLVGVVAADIGLAVPSYRSSERTFQILSQVTGRAGRADTPGRSIIQTMQPSHPSIVAAARQDYAGFYQQEIELRKRYGLPPWARYVRLVYGSFEETDAQLEAASVKTRIDAALEARPMFAVTAIGPSPTFPVRFRGQYRWQILLRGEEPSRVLDDTPLGRGWGVDVDPTDMN